MNTKNHQVIIKHLGDIAYEEAWKLQETLFNEIVQIKLENRRQTHTPPKKTPNYLIFCEHPHVYTLGRSGSIDHLLVDKKYLQKQGIQFHETNRGGDITYHGPGQLVVYPVLDLENFFTDVHRYLRLLEEAVIATLEDFGLDGGRVKGYTGVWVGYKNEHRAMKLCAIGVRVSRWVTMHGLALNVDPDLSYFKQIVPCGIKRQKVSSMAAVLGAPQSLSAVAERLEFHILRLLTRIDHCRILLNMHLNTSGEGKDSFAIVSKSDAQC